MNIIKWFKSWGQTWREIWTFIKKHPQMFVLYMIGGHLVMLTIMLTQRFMIQNTDATAYLSYEPVIVSDVPQGRQALGQFVRSSHANYTLNGKMEFYSLGVEGVDGDVFSPPPIEFPKYVKKGDTKNYEYIPTEKLKPGKYSFTLARSFCVTTWIGDCIPKQVLVVSDKFEVKP